MKKFNQVLEKGLEKTFKVEANSTIKLSEDVSQNVNFSFDVKAHDGKEAEQKARKTFECLNQTVNYSINLKS